MPERIVCGRRILVLDGGISALSQLYILEEIVNRIKFDGKLDEAPRPWELYDMIVGSGQGGVVAILLGRLRMSVEEAIAAYIRLSTSITRIQCLEDRRRNTRSFCATFDDILKDTGRSSDEKMLERDPNCCKVVIFLTPAANMTHARRVYSYPTRNSHNVEILISKCALATSASPFLFEPTLINGERFIDGTFSVPNPSREAVVEAQQVFEDASLILSIGAGRNRVVFLPPDAELEALYEIFKERALDCEPAHEDMSRSLGKSRVYHRLNVQRGLENQDLQGQYWAGDIASHTTAYLQEDAITKRVNRVVSALIERVPDGKPLADIVTAIAPPPPPHQKQHHYKKRKPSSPTSQPLKRRRLSSCSESTDREEEPVCDTLAAYDIDDGDSSDMRVFTSPSSQAIEKKPRWPTWVLRPVGFGFPLVVIVTMLCDQKLGGPSGFVPKDIWSV